MSEHPCTTCPNMVAEGDCGSRCEVLSDALFEALAEVARLRSVPAQLCPMCHGQGIVSKPPWVAGDQNEWIDSSSSHVCPLCNGKRILAKWEQTQKEDV